jgi:hypothetical protein
VIKAWFVMLAALIGLLAIGPHPGFNPTLPIIGILAFGFTSLMWMISPPGPTSRGASDGANEAYLATADSLDIGGSSGACDGGSAGGGDCGCSC